MALTLQEQLVHAILGERIKPEAAHDITDRLPLADRLAEAHIKRASGFWPNTLAAKASHLKPAQVAAAYLAAEIGTTGDPFLWPRNQYKELLAKSADGQSVFSAWNAVTANWTDLFNTAPSRLQNAMHALNRMHASFSSIHPRAQEVLSTAYALLRALVAILTNERTEAAPELPTLNDRPIRAILEAAKKQWPTDWEVQLVTYGPAQVAADPEAVQYYVDKVLADVLEYKSAWAIDTVYLPADAVKAFVPKGPIIAGMRRDAEFYGMSGVENFVLTALSTSALGLLLLPDAWPQALQQEIANRVMQHLEAEFEAEVKKMSKWVPKWAFINAWGAK